MAAMIQAKAVFVRNNTVNLCEVGSVLRGTMYTLVPPGDFSALKKTKKLTILALQHAIRKNPLHETTARVVAVVENPKKSFLWKPFTEIQPQVNCETALVVVMGGAIVVDSELKFATVGDGLCTETTVATIKDLVSKLAGEPGVAGSSHLSLAVVLLGKHWHSCSSCDNQYTVTTDQSMKLCSQCVYIVNEQCKEMVKAHIKPGETCIGVSPSSQLLSSCGEFRVGCPNETRTAYPRPGTYDHSDVRLAVLFNSSTTFQNVFMQSKMNYTSDEYGVKQCVIQEKHVEKMNQWLVSIAKEHGPNYIGWGLVCKDYRCEKCDAWFGKKNKGAWCGGCKKVMYCNATCQNAHRDAHRKANPDCKGIVTKPTQ